METSEMEEPPQPPQRRIPGAQSARVIRDSTARAFDTRTERWERAGLSEQVSSAEAKKALAETLLFLLLLIGTLIVFSFRQDLFPGAGKPIRFATAALLVIFGWGLARSVGKGIAPSLMRRMDPATAGSVSFLIRLAAILFVVIASLGVAGVKPQTLAVGGAFTAVILGLAAQQTLGNLIAGATLISTRPFKVADRVRVQGSGVNLEGTVSSLGLFYTTLVDGADRMLIPNSLLMSIAVIPLGEPDPVELTARFETPEITPSLLGDELVRRIEVPLLRKPKVELAEVDSNEVATFSIKISPRDDAEAAQLASEVLEVVRTIGGEGNTEERERQPVAPIDE